VGGGTVTGTVFGSELRLVVTPPQPNICPVNATATLDDDVIQGNYAAFNCSVSNTGTFRVERQ
jgi:hypothetical protein